MSDQIFARFNGNEPADAYTINRIQKDSGVELPREYIEFLERMDGGEGFIGANYVVFWRIRELKAMNDGYRVNQKARNLFLFGSDGGGEGFAFAGKDARTVVAVPLLDLDVSQARVCGKSFSDFLRSLSAIPLSDFLIVGVR